MFNQDNVQQLGKIQSTRSIFAAKRWKVQTYTCGPDQLGTFGIRNWEQSTSKLQIVVSARVYICLCARVCVCV